MPNIGPAELILILIVLLLVVGPGKLPDVGSALGKTIREFRKASSDVQDSIRVDASPTAPTQPAQPTQPVQPTQPATSAQPNTLSEVAQPNVVAGVDEGGGAPEGPKA